MLPNRPLIIKHKNTLNEDQMFSMEFCSIQLYSVQSVLGNRAEVGNYNQADLHCSCNAFLSDFRLPPRSKTYVWLP